MKETNFKENLNNKLNLPTTWTKKKMASLLLMSWLSVNGVEAGQAFVNCLNNNNDGYIDTTSYNELLIYPWSNDNTINSGGILNICCDKIKCSSIATSSLCPTGTSNTNSVFFACSKLAQAISCEGGNYLCAGIVGDNQITSSTTLGACSPYSLSKVNNYISNITPKSINEKFPWWSCPTGSPCEGMFCGWDNDGWTCSNEKCFLQWSASWPGPSYLNPFTATATTSLLSPTVYGSSTLTVTTKLIVPSTISVLPSDPHLAEKIAIPVGTVVGVVAVGGVTYLIYKKRKKNNPTSQEQNNSNIELVETNREADAHEIVEEDKDNDGGELITKQQELENLINQTKNKIGKKLEVSLETLLDTQAEITKGNNTYTLRQTLREAKEKLMKKITSEEIDNLCQLQSEIVQTTEQVLTNLSEQRPELQAQIQIPPKN